MPFSSVRCAGSHGRESEIVVTRDDDLERLEEPYVPHRIAGQ